MATDLNSQGRYAHIDALRGFAVLLVVVNHAGISQVPGQSGVTLFFAISGFIITHIVLRERERTDRFRIGRFYTNRFFKLAPPLAVLILAPTCIYAAIGHTVNWWAVSSQALFSYNWVEILDRGVDQTILPGSQVTWSLAVEEQFYICFAIIWLMLLRLPIDRARICLSVLAIAAIVIATTLRWLAWDDEWYVVRATTTRLDSIAWGVLAAIAFSWWRAGKLPQLARLGSLPTLIVAAALYLGSDFAPNGLSFSMHSLAAILFILWGLLPGRGRVRKTIYAISSSRPIETLGLASYSIYLGHAPVIFWLLPLVTSSWSPLAVIVAGVLLSLIVSIAAWRFIEQPTLKWRRSHIDTRFAVPQQATTTVKSY